MTAEAARAGTLDGLDGLRGGAADGWGGQLQEWLRGEEYRNYAHVRILQEHYERQAFHRLLDVGCGTGQLMRQFLARGVDCVGIDNSRQIMDFHATNGELAVLSASVSDLPFGDAAFDMTTCLGLVEHLADPVAALRELRRVTRPGGRAVITVPRRWSPFPVLVPLWYFSGGRHRYGWKNMVGTMYGRRSLVRQLRAAGWAVEAVTPFKSTSLLEWLGVPFSRTWADRCERPGPVATLLGIMWVAHCRRES